MRRSFTVVLLLLPALAALTLAEDRSALFSNPVLPSREALDRLNLRQAWFTSFPMDGRRDGFLSTVIHGNQLLVQTRSGVVGAIDLETGRILWRTLPGRPYRTGTGLAVNTASVFVLSGTELYALNRRTGEKQWEFRLPAGISTPPVADDEQIYLCGANSRLYAARLPRYDATGRYVATEVELGALGRTIGSPETRALVGGDSDGGRADATLPGLYRTPPPPQGPRPTLVWEVQTNQALEQRPVFDSDVIVVAGNDSSIRAGRVMGYVKFPHEDFPKEVFRFPLDKPLIAAPASFGHTVYVGGADANLWAINMASGRVEWRFITGDSIVRAPVPTEKDLFVTSQLNGMFRLDRESGESGWRIPSGNQVLDHNIEADRYLASNPKYVYALDRAGRLLVLDRLQGTTLSRIDVTDYVYPIVNDQNDRLFLAANNGSIVCLHDKEYTSPFRHQGTKSDLEQMAVKLRKPATQPAVVNVPFRTFLRDFAKAHDLKLMISERAFRSEEKLDNLTRLINLPAIAGKPVGEVLNQALAQIQATSIIVRDTIIIAPAGAGPAPGPMGGAPRP